MWREGKDVCGLSIDDGIEKSFVNEECNFKRTSIELPSATNFEYNFTCN